MSSLSANEPDQYALMSSYYGPGATLGWYLTALACLISLGLHPRKRSLDSITADTIAVLAFPTVAAAHLISQVRSYPRNMQRSRDSTLAQNAVSVEAALVVIETFLAIDVIMFLLAIGFKCVRRGCLLAAVGLFCYFAECYCYFSIVRQAIEHNFDRPFLINSGSILISIMAILLVYIIFALGLIVLFFAMRPKVSRVRTFEQDAEATREDLERDFKQSHHALVLTWVTILFLPCSFLASLLRLGSGAFRDLPSHFLPWLRAAASHIAHDLIPRSNFSVKELDQAVAILAGATVLGFSLYSTADSYYQASLSRTCARLQQREIELRRIQNSRY